MTEPAITVRGVLRRLLEGGSYPRRGNEDWRAADRMETEALVKAAGAISSPGDPPEYGRWLEALRKPGLRNLERDEIYAAMHDHFDEAMEKVTLRLIPWRYQFSEPAGDADTGKAILRDYIKATVGFEKLGEATGTPPKSLIRLLGPRGNPQARNLFGIIGYLQRQAGVELHVAAGPS
jgi:hypothetical protein